MRFLLAEQGRSWYEWQAFGECCEAAGLSVEQAEAARLAACHLRYGEIAEALSLLRGRNIGMQSAREKVLDAEKRLRRCLPKHVALHRRDAKELLAAIRNMRGTSPHVAIYRESMGVHDRDPVRFTSRLLGECVEDLTNAPRRFLKDLPSLIERVAESRAVRE